MHMQSGGHPVLRTMTVLPKSYLKCGEILYQVVVSMMLSLGHSLWSSCWDWRRWRGVHIETTSGVACPAWRRVGEREKMSCLVTFVNCPRMRLFLIVARGDLFHMHLEEGILAKISWKNSYLEGRLSFAQVLHRLLRVLSMRKSDVPGGMALAWSC